MRVLVSLVGAAAVVVTLPSSSSASTLSSLSVSDVRGISPALQLKLASVSTVRTLALPNIRLMSVIHDS